MSEINYHELLKKIVAKIKEDPREYRGYFDAVDCLVKWSKEDVRTPYAYADTVLQMLNKAMSVLVKEKEYRDAEQFRQLRYALLKWSAPKNFDHYMQALEYDRPVQERFYYPRRHILLPHVKALQRLADDQLDELFLSQPPRTGKSTLVTFFYTWIIGRNPELSNLYVSYSDSLASAFYSGMLEIMQDKDTYKWADIFETRKIATTNAKNSTFDVDRAKKYHSFTARSLYGSLNGSTDCTGILCGDDLLSGIEEALNPDRLATAWAHVDNNMLTRAKQGAKVLWIGTRWSIADPIGKRLDLLQSDPKFTTRRFEVINIPALNENDESNFVYKYNVGFDTTYFQQRRASFEAGNDLASWSAQYQGEPIEREGTLFEPDGMQYYNGELPDRKPDRIFTAVDPAFGGGDYTAAPIVYQYGRNEFYVVDVVYNNGEKNITQPLLASKAKKWGLQAMQVEATKATRPYVEGIQEEIDKIEYHLTIMTRSAPTHVAKEQRIYDKASDIRAYFYFLDTAHRTKEYNLFMQNMFSFKLTGKNKHDDAPDSMAMTAEMAFRNFDAKVEIMPRPF